MYRKDLSVYEYWLNCSLSAVRCVGWIDSGHEYERGQPSNGLLEKLKQVVATRTPTFDAHVNVVRGIHPCNICGEIVRLNLFGRNNLLGVSEIWLPIGSQWLAAPSLVLHYIECHDYLPPVEFTNAVMAVDFGNPFIGQEVCDRLLKELAAQATGS